jgi:hypothetical protein
VVAAPTPALSSGGSSAAGASLLAAYLGALALAEWVLTVSVPVAAGCFGLLAVAACFAPFLPWGRRGAALLPVLLAMPVAQLIVLATPTADLAPLSRLGLLAVPTMVAVTLAARACPRDWHLGSSTWCCPRCNAVRARGGHHSSDGLQDRNYSPW